MTAVNTAIYQGYDSNASRVTIQIRPNEFRAVQLYPWETVELGSCVELYNTNTLSGYVILLSAQTYSAELPPYWKESNIQYENPYRFLCSRRPLPIGEVIDRENFGLPMPHPTWNRNSCRVILRNRGNGIIELPVELAGFASTIRPAINLQNYIKPHTLETHHIALRIQNNFLKPGERQVGVPLHLDHFSDWESDGIFVTSNGVPTIFCELDLPYSDSLSIALATRTAFERIPRMFLEQDLRYLHDLLAKQPQLAETLAESGPWNECLSFLGGSESDLSVVVVKEESLYVPNPWEIDYYNEYTLHASGVAKEAISRDLVRGIWVSPRSKKFQELGWS